MSQGIFISYRRDDTRAIAGRLYAALKTAFPKKRIFFDVDIPEPGNEIIAKIAVPEVRERLTTAIEHELAITESRATG